jgi:hypothetical protein
MNYYTYAYLREDRTPYYIGKGSGRRAYVKNHRINLPEDKNRIIILKKQLTEKEAFRHEEYMIFILGRKDLGTGILRNMSEGGSGGASGYKHTKNTCKFRSERMKGNKIWEGRKHSDISKQKVREARKGKKLSDKHIEKLEESHSKYNWKVISPDKNIFVIKNLTKFCKENNLAPSPLYNYGKYKGWTVEKVAQGT